MKVNKKVDVTIFESKEKLNQAFTDWLKAILSERGTLSIALSGGSTPKSLFDYWAQLPNDAIDWTKIRFFWGDERCVPPTDDASNYRMTKENLFDKITIPAGNIFRIHGENNPENEAQRYGDLLKQELACNNAFPVFDIVMLGMGDDGHTASIFPHEIDLWQSPEVCVVGTHPESGQLRVSLSGSTINAARNVAFLVIGEAKADKVNEIIASPEQLAQKYPAALVQPKSGRLIWFLDNPAAKLL